MLRSITRRAAVLLLALGVAAPVLARTVRIVQTNSAGTTVSLIDPATNKVVGTIHGIEANHGATTDGTHLFISDEAAGTLEVADPKSLKVIKSIKLTGHPNNVDISRDGRKVYVAIRAEPGAVDVIDTKTLTRVNSIPTGTPIHNPVVTPDGKFVVAGSIEDKKIVVIDTATEKPVWSLDFGAGVRPMIFERKPDGSTGRMFIQLSDYNGFVIVDFDTHKEITRVPVPEIPAAQRVTDVLQGAPSHGIGITPDGKTLWVASAMNKRVYVYSMPDVKLVAEAPTGGHPEWITFSPDSKSVYIANASTDDVSVFDVASRKEVTRIPVGYVPKRNITAVLP